MATFIIDNLGTLWSDPQAIALRPKPRSRKWAPKKRTGCLTCRQRRVRCDEGKPSCQRCVIGSRECVGNGYSAPSSSGISSDDPDPKLLIPVRRTASGLAFQPEVCVSPAGVQASTRERMQFYFLRQEAASSMAGVFDRKFCLRDMLQATSVHPIVWHASCALAAMFQRESLMAEAKIHRRRLREGGESVDEVAATKDVTLAERQNLRNFALEQYNISIAGVLDLMKSAPIESLSDMELEVLLTTTLLFTAISSLQGNIPAAVVHVINGQRLWHQWHKNIDQTQQKTGKKKYLGSSMLNPRSVGAVMGRLVTQSSAIRPAPWSADYYKSLETPVVSSDAFDTPEDAYYEFEPLCRGYFELMESNKSIIDPAQKRPGPRVRQAYASALAAWTAKFDAMRRLPGMMDTPLHLEAILVLQARQLELSIYIERDPSGAETTWDAFTPRFDRIITVGEQLRGSLRQAGGRVFSFSSSMFDAAFLTATYCRDTNVRHRALALLQAHNAREGLCNSRLAHAIAKAWVEIEEAPGEMKLTRQSAAAGGRGACATPEENEEYGEECTCEAGVFVCNDHRIAIVAGQYFEDDLGTLTYWNKRAVDRGLSGEVRELAW
ncbi:hypothetical protein NLG97_g7177 [Lecanicillium saksenae]|uniref:Uncharacterized protein n=1 Tax=Lecanicillium saksenae TaxID=468837 RepID=A0ACC1QMK2_9HYPO|nr:hypothetical protein NLG97_g7177 [Lecanicillium saksenae]